MTEKLYKQVDGTEWSWKNLNTVHVTLLLSGGGGGGGGLITGATEA